MTTYKLCFLGFLRGEDRCMSQRPLSDLTPGDHKTHCVEISLTIFQYLVYTMPHHIKALLNFTGWMAIHNQQYHNNYQCKVSDQYHMIYRKQTIDNQEVTSDQNGHPCWSRQTAELFQCTGNSQQKTLYRLKIGCFPVIHHYNHGPIRGIHRTAGHRQINVKAYLCRQLVTAYHWHTLPLITDPQGQCNCLLLYVWSWQLVVFLSESGQIKTETSR